MKIATLVNNDIHSAKALNLLLPLLRKHKIKIILSKKVGGDLSLAKELIELKSLEQQRMNEVFARLDKNKISKNGFKSFNQIANFFGIEVTIYENINGNFALSDLKNFAPDLLISIRFGQILKQPIISIPRYGVINLHSGILPNYRGILATFWAILNGEKEIGTTLHYISDSSIDEGDILGYSKTKIDWNKSLIANINNLYEDGCAILFKTIKKISAKEKILSTSQAEFGEGRYFSYPQENDIKKFLKLMPLYAEQDVDEIYKQWE